MSKGKRIPKERTKTKFDPVLLSKTTLLAVIKKEKKKVFHYKKTTLRKGENICQQSNRQGMNLQNIQIAYEAQYHKNKQCNQKMGRTPKQTFL